MSAQRSLRAAIAWASVYVLFPLVLCLDIHNWSFVIGFNAMVAVMILFALRAWRRKTFGLRSALLGNLVMACLVSRLIGPFMITPVILCGVLLVVTANPWLNRRTWLVLTWVAFATLGPLLLEQLGVLTRTWRVEEGAVASMSTVFGIHGAVETAMLVTANVVLVGLVALFALGMNRDRGDAHRKLRIQAWHLGQLLPKPKPTLE